MSAAPVSINWTADDPVFLDVRVAAQKASVSPGTIKAAIYAGTLKARRSGVDADGNPVGKYLMERQALEDWFNQLVAA